MIKVGKCKALARETLRGRYGTVVGAEILSLIVSILFGAAAAGSLLAAIMYSGKDGSGHSLAVIITGSCLFTIFLFLFIIFTIYMSIGMYKLLLNICTGERYSAGNIFYGFRSGSHVGRVFWIGVILFLIEYIFHLIFSYLASLYYRMNGPDSAAGIALCLGATLVLELILYWILMGFYVSGLVVLSDPSYRIGAALSESRRLMKGAKLKAFWLDKLSFIFWDILTLLCPPARLWVSPYKKTTKVILYLAARGELDKLPIAGEVSGGSGGDAPVSAPETAAESELQTADVSGGAHDMEIPSAGDEAKAPLAETAAAGIPPEETPIEEAPAAEIPPAETSAAEAPAAETPPAEAPAAETSATETLTEKATEPDAGEPGSVVKE